MKVLPLVCIIFSFLFFYSSALFLHSVICAFVLFTYLETPLLTKFSEGFELQRVEVKTEKHKLVVGGTVEVIVELKSLLPCPMQVQQASFSMEKLSVKDETNNDGTSNATKSNSSARAASVTTSPSDSKFTLKRY